jgi:hypothetical protein
MADMFWQTATWARLSDTSPDSMQIQSLSPFAVRRLNLRHAARQQLEPRHNPPAMGRGVSETQQIHPSKQDNEFYSIG